MKLTCLKLLLNTQRNDYFKYQKLHVTIKKTIKINT